MSKFVVGDIVKGIANRYAVTNIKMTRGEVTKTYPNSPVIEVKVLEHKDEWAVNHIYYDLMDAYFELVEAKKELTFLEVLQKIQPGERYECTRVNANVKAISLGRNSFNFDVSCNGDYAIRSTDTFKLIVPKKLVKLARVEHRQDGKKYDFITDELIEVGDFVVCNTKYGKSYGRVFYCYTKELTDEEIKAYKTCKKVD